MHCGLSIYFHMLVCADLYEIPEAFLLSLTRIYLSSVITYSLMYNTLGWVDGGGGSEMEKTEQRGENVQACIFSSFPRFQLSPACLLTSSLSHTYLILGGGLSRVLRIMKVDISPRLSRPSDMNCCSVLPLVHLTWQHK